jgi:hypothetical protein
MIDTFCTLFDVSFAPQGIAMLSSLDEFMPKARKVVLAMDDEVAPLLQSFFGNKVHVIRLEEIETPALIKVKAERTRGEYCWTLTPFLPAFVLDQFSDSRSITYVDADVYFFRSPQSIIEELIQAVG